jgi:DNA-binding NarL/FixJ family response regulator
MVEDLCKDERKVVATRVLLVEDHEPFRRFVRAALAEHADFCLVDEACDGLQAVHKFQELEPDLVLMDIGLPGQNGLLAARKMLALAPACRIVFLTQEGSPEIVEEALKLGAAGYVLKAHAAGELLPAVLAARDGRLFMSTVMARCNQPDAVRGRATGSRPSREARRDDDHPAHFHRDDSSLFADFTGFTEGALKSGYAVLMLLVEAHRHEVLHSLRGRGVDIEQALNSERLVIVDVDQTLASFMVNGMPDPDLFFQTAGGVVNAIKAANPGTRVVACGEIAPTLWARGNGKAAVEVERLWDQLVRTADLTTLCGYVLRDSQRERETDIYQSICGFHSAVCAF